MNSFFKSFKFKVIVCIMSFFLGIGLYSVAKGGTNSGFSELIGVVLNPVKKFSNGISDKVSLVINLFTDAEVYVAENQHLREQVANLNKRLIDYEDVKAENEDLRKFIGIKEENEDIVLSPVCTIISRVANDPYGTFIIDKGSNDGIKLYAPVVTAEGLVGVVEKVANTYSTVRTILSPDLSVGGLCIESRDTGIIEGNLSYAADGKCKMIYLDKGHKIKKGDLIVTSGNSGQFPQGYVIGNVTETGIEESGLTCYAVVQPAVDTSKISSVMVIKEFDKVEDENQIEAGELGEQQATEPATDENSTEQTDAYSDETQSYETEPENGNYGNNELTNEEAYTEAETEPEYEEPEYSENSTESGDE